MKPNFYVQLSSIHSLMNEVDEDDILGGNVSDDEIIIDPNMNIDYENLPYNSYDNELDEQACENETRNFWQTRNNCFKRQLGIAYQKYSWPNVRASPANIFQEKNNLPPETKNNTTLLIRKTVNALHRRSIDAGQIPKPTSLLSVSFKCEICIRLLML